MLEGWYDKKTARKVYKSGEHVLDVRVMDFDPTQAYISGIHGDEGGVIPLVKRALIQRSLTKPRSFRPHLCISEAHPDALAQQTREGRGVDLNRMFPDSGAPEYPQAALIAQAFADHPTVHTVFSFHEDCDLDQFYMYSTPQTREQMEQDARVHRLRDRLRRGMTAQEIKLHTGIDDVNLLYHVDRGYHELPATEVSDGSFEGWVAKPGNHRSVRQVFLFEIPMIFSPRRKMDTIDVIFNEFIGPYLAGVQGK